MTERVLSIFIDESGDFGPYDHHAPFYFVAMILHDQNIPIAESIASMEEHMRNLGYAPHAVHTGPLIRRESIYANDRMEDRLRLFNALFHFTRKLDIHYACAMVKKRECADVIALTAALSRAIATVLQEHQTYFRNYDRIIVYYDNGQVELTKILTSVMNALFVHVEFRKVRPVDYKLFQAADLVCTLELLAQKADAGQLSRSELEFFHSVRDFKKNYWKPIQKKKLT